MAFWRSWVARQDGAKGAETRFEILRAMPSDERIAEQCGDLHGFLCQHGCLVDQSDVTHISRRIESRAECAVDEHSRVVCFGIEGNDGGKPLSILPVPDHEVVPSSSRRSREGRPGLRMIGPAVQAPVVNPSLAYAETLAHTPRTLGQVVSMI